MEFHFFRNPILMISLATLSVLTCFEVPIFVSAFVLILWIWKRLSDARQISILPRKVTTILSVLLLGFILFQYRTLFAEEPASALLVGLTALKVMDYCNQRDHLIVVLLGFLLLTLKPLFGMDLYLFPIQMACMFGLWWSLTERQQEKVGTRRKLWPIYLGALPIGAFLFVVFPRVVLPWAASQSHYGMAQMGFSGDLNPGQVAELASSSNLAFRVQFLSGEVPDIKDMYWKGVVLEKSDGLAWKARTHSPIKHEPSSETAVDPIRYQVILEPGSNENLFTLDPTIHLQLAEGSAVSLEGHVWKATSVSGKSQVYQAETVPEEFDSEPPGSQDLEIPHLPPQSAAWVAQTKLKFSSLPERKQALKTLFSDPDLIYTLSPGIYKSGDLDEFLFHRKRGFCEHFSGAYATLARALGIPARVVAGYQGAELNPLGQFWKVTQRQSHAWVETWTGKQWIRQDPTTWVQKNEFTRYQRQTIFEWFNQAEDVYEALNFRWTSFLIDFDQQSQKSFLREWTPKAFLIVILLMSFSFLVRLIWNWASKSGSQQRQQDELSDLIQEIYQFQETKTGQTLTSVPPVSLLERIQQEEKTHSVFFQDLQQLYEQVFYRSRSNGGSESTFELQSLIRQWRVFQKQKRNS